MNIHLFELNENNIYYPFYESVTSSGFMPQLLYIHVNPIHLTRSLIIYLQITLRKITKKLYTRIISDHQMTCCILPNHNAVKRVNRAYIEVANINEKNTWRS